MPKNRVEVEFRLSMVWEGDEEPEAMREHVASLMYHYLEDKEAPLFEDYGRGAWGGYDGPFLLRSKLKEENVGQVRP